MAETHDSRSSSGSAGLMLRRASDERLARLAGKGDARAFAALYERHHQPLYRLCLSIVRVPDDARDALQSTFERAFAALRAREREIAVRPWLFRIAHNESITVLRRRRPGEALPEAELPSLHTVEGAVEERARLSALVADIHSLPERQRSVLLMRELSGLSIAEVAAAMSMSSSAVKQSLFEARGSLHAYAEGRAMSCEEVRHAISDGDGRALRSRKLRAHLRDCGACTQFRSLISAREGDLRALAPPLPAAAAAAVLTGLLGSGAGTHAGSVAAGPALVAAKGGASSLALKGVTGLALAAALGAGAAHLASGPAVHHRTPAHARANGAAAHHSRGAAGTQQGGSPAAANAHARGSHATARHRTAARAPVSAAAPVAASPGASARGAEGANGVRAHGAPAAARKGTRAHGTPPRAHTPQPRKPKQPSARSHTNTPIVPRGQASEHAQDQTAARSTNASAS
ncbi:MAG TPA: RNA polymerase sigma factor, partial [Solirubrobacteraceae bacterium]|nr:RNA polymerase sigma factor [Solirubrobacteraceae bacterium]